MFRSLLLLLLACFCIQLPLLAQDAATSPSALAGMQTAEVDLNTSLRQHLLDLEKYVGMYQSELEELLGQPLRTEVQREGVAEREAQLWFYSFELMDSHQAHWRIALQNERVVGLAVATTEDPERIYAGTIAFMGENNQTVGNASGYENRKVARRGNLIWDVNLANEVYGRAAIVNVGTVKYKTCDKVWDIKRLHGTDGFGNPLPQSPIRPVGQQE